MRRQLNHRIDIDPRLRKYCEDHNTQEDAVLREVESSTQLNTVKRHDASDALQGRILSFISHICKPDLIVEVGSFSGYGTACLAEGLSKGGKIISIEHNPIYKPMIQRHLAKLGLSDIVDLRIGDALEILPSINTAIDLLFIDGAKYEYAAYYDLTIDRVSSGGVILADNILWKGRVLDEKKDRMTESIHRFNEKVAADPRVEVVILPYRDGLSLIRKK